ncbi:MAG: peptide deformylase [Candidatus Hydrogenedentes bacterium]|nr:peptide deformylase [Candidatus Hydrogenedentota bacterium]
MSVLNVVLYPDDPLTKTAAPVDSFGPNLAELASNMFETMYAFDGVGLAAPQVGLEMRLFVLHEPEGEKMCLVNPEIVERDGEEFGQEGCLSLPDIYVQVPRAKRIGVRAQDVYGEALEFEANDFLARIIQHESDHLDGVIFLDRVDVLTQNAMLQEWKGIRERLLATSTTGSRPRAF